MNRRRMRFEVMGSKNDDLVIKKVPSIQIVKDKEGFFTFEVTADEKEALEDLVKQIEENKKNGNESTADIF